MNVALTRQRSPVQIRCLDGTDESTTPGENPVRPTNSDIAAHALYLQRERYCPSTIESQVSSMKTIDSAPLPQDRKPVIHPSRIKGRPTNRRIPKRIVTCFLKVLKETGVGRIRSHVKDNRASMPVPPHELTTKWNCSIITLFDFLSNPSYIPKRGR